MAALRKIKIAIKTSSDAHAGTNASIFFVLASSNRAHIYRLPTHREEMEGGMLDIYPVELQDAPDIADIQSVFLVNGMEGRNPSWRILWVRIDATDTNGNGWTMADVMLEQWLDVEEGHAPVAAVPLLRPAVNLGPTDPVGHPMTSLAPIQAG